MCFSVHKLQHPFNSGYTEVLTEPQLANAEKKLAYGLIHADSNLWNLSLRSIDMDRLGYIADWKNPLGAEQETIDALERILGYSYKFYVRASSDKYPETFTLKSLMDFFRKREVSYNADIAYGKVCEVATRVKTVYETVTISPIQLPMNRK